MDIRNMGDGQTIPNATATTPLLSVENLQVSFHTYAGEVRAVRGISFHLNAGETLAFVGESGCGKSVTAKALMRLLPRRSSEIKEGSRICFAGRDVARMNRQELRRLRGNDIAMIFQDPMTSLDPTMRVGRQIEESLKLHQPISGAEASRKAMELLQLVQIPNAAMRVRAYPHELSGGMRQRVMIAMALSCRPQLLIADEPTTALDVSIQAQILKLIQDLKDELDMAVILVTHDLGVVANFADRIQVMYAGTIVEEGRTEDIFYRARHPYSWALLNSIPGRQQDEVELRSLGGTPPDLILPLTGCPFVARCSKAMKICASRHPALHEMEADHRSACWLEHPLAAQPDWQAMREGAY